MQALEQWSLKAHLDCLREPSGQNWEAREQKTSPHTHLHLLPDWQGFQAAGSHLSPTCHCSLHAQLLYPYPLVDAPKETNKTSPYRIFRINVYFILKRIPVEVFFFLRKWFQIDLLENHIFTCMNWTFAQHLQD